MPRPIEMFGGVVDKIRRIYKKRPTAHEPADAASTGNSVVVALSGQRATRAVIVHAGTSHKLARGFISIMIAAVVAGLIGFGVGAYIVPIEGAARFRNGVNGGLNLIYGARQPNKDDTRVQPMKASQAKAPAPVEMPPKEAEPDVSSRTRSGSNSECGMSDLKCAGWFLPDAVAPAGGFNRDTANPTSPPAARGDTQPAPTSRAEGAAPLPAATPPAVETGAKVRTADTKRPLVKKKPKPKPRPPAIEQPADQPIQPAE